MKITAIPTLTADQAHLESLRRHGARVPGRDGKLTELNSYFVDEVINQCILNGATAMTFNLYLPGIDEALLIAIWNNGHIDSGSAASVLRVLDR